MAELLVFDPALCCSTGVCGPEVDPALVRFAADLEWLGKRGVEIRRFNLAQEPSAFANNGLVRRTLQEEGPDCLPLIMAGGEIVSRGRYAARDELAVWSGVVAEPTRSSEVSDQGSAAGVAGDSACRAPILVGLVRSNGTGSPSSGCY